MRFIICSFPSVSRAAAGARAVDVGGDERLLHQLDEPSRPMPTTGGRRRLTSTSGASHGEHNSPSESTAAR
jgi:hypothetical protein